MTLNDLLLSRLLPCPTRLPGTLTAVTISVAFQPDAISRGVPEQVVPAITQTLDSAMPLFRAGFAESAPGKGHICTGRSRMAFCHFKTPGSLVTICQPRHWGQRYFCSRVQNHG